MKPFTHATRMTALLVGAAFTLLWFAGAASAHVTVAAPGVTAGASDAVITLRVPDESDTASTIGLKLQLPTATPIAGVLVAPQPGWTATITQSKLAKPIHTDDGDIAQVVSEVDWTAATGAGIKPGFFGEFTIIGGKLPDNVSDLTFKAVQHYSDGKDVSWIQVAAPGSTTDPEFPAPTLHLSPAGSTPASSTPASSTRASSTPASSTPSVGAKPAATTTDAASKGAATTGIILGALGLLPGLAAIALVLTRMRGTASPTPAPRD